MRGASACVTADCAEGGVRGRVGSQRQEQQACCDQQRQSENLIQTPVARRSGDEAKTLHGDMPFGECARPVVSPAARLSTGQGRQGAGCKTIEDMAVDHQSTFDYPRERA